jgi:hypothetical protein
MIKNKHVLEYIRISLEKRRVNGEYVNNYRSESSLPLVKIYTFHLRECTSKFRIKISMLLDGESRKIFRCLILSFLIIASRIECRGRQFWIFYFNLIFYIF